MMFRRQTILVRSIIALPLAFSFLATVGPAAAQKTVKVDFNSTQTYTDSYGTQHTAVLSGLANDYRTAIIAKAQQKFDAALGANQILISQGSGGDMDVIMSGEQYGWYGNIGAANGPAVVDTEVFRLMKDAFNQPSFPAGAPYQNAVGETLAHEIAHRLGVAHNRLTNPYRIMTDGKLVPPEGRTPGTRQFTAGDITVMTKNLPKINAMPSDAFGQPPPVGGEMGASSNPQMLGDGGLCIDAYLTVTTGPVGAEFGYISNSNEFIYQAAVGESDRYMTIHRTGPIEFAVQMPGGPVYRSSGPYFTFTLSDPNPYLSNGYKTLIGEFDTPQGPATFRLDATIKPELGGFVSFVPEPEPTVLLVIAGFIAVARRPDPGKKRC